MPSGSPMQTFVVRVWSAASEANGAGGLHGVVQHVASGREETFKGDGELLDFLRALPQAQTDAAGAGEES